MKSIEIRNRSIFLGFCVLLSVFVSKIQAQRFENLYHLEGYGVNTYFSEGSKEQAETMAARCERVMSFYKPLIDFEPKVTLLVLSPADWSSYTRFPVYGMPHYSDSATLVVASQDNDFWKSFIPPLDQLPPELGAKISSTYSNTNDQLTMRGFFDLLAIHELGHAFHLQGGLTMQRKWMEELFANILLHTYIAEKEPELLSALTVFPKMVVSSANKEELNYTTLPELESNYATITQQFPQNYGWYQSRWHIAANTIYNEGGILAFQNLWRILKNQSEVLDDTEFATLLLNKVHPSVAEVQQNWNED